MTKVRFLLAIILLAGLAAVGEAIYLAHRAATPATSAPIALAPAAPAVVNPSPSGEGGPKRPREEFRPATASLAHAGQSPRTNDATTVIELGGGDSDFVLLPATESSAASATPARSDVELERARQVLADHQIDNLLAKLHLTDQQQQLGKDPIDHLRNSMKNLISSGQGLQETMHQKIANFHDQGLSDDQIAGLIRPDLEALVDRMSDQLTAMGDATIQLQYLMTPDQLTILKQMTDGFQKAPAQMKSSLTSDAQLKNFVQMFK
jgi:hypothetical protein